MAFALIKTDGLDAEGRERISREAQAMGKLGTHPHIVSVFDMGFEAGDPHPSPLPGGDGNGTPDVVTELMGGGDVEGLLERVERAEALEHLNFAIAEFREMKMQPALERALKHKGLLHA